MGIEEEYYIIKIPQMLDKTMDTYTGYKTMDREDIKLWMERT